MKKIFLLHMLYLCWWQVSVAQSQAKLVGGPCEGCEAVFEYGARTLNATDTLPGFDANEPKLLISGTIFQQDGKTPASDVIVYIYHTNRQGIYETKGNEKGWARRHGIYRGWLKTGADGRYQFYAFRPAAYPNGREPEHIHLTVKEPNKNEYYIDSIVFEDDPLLTKEERENMKDRGGSGIVHLKKHGYLYQGQRNIILGQNIPNYK